MLIKFYLLNNYLKKSDQIIFRDINKSKTIRGKNFKKIFSEKSLIVNDNFGKKFKYLIKKKHPKKKLIQLKVKQKKIFLKIFGKK